MFIYKNFISKYSIYLRNFVRKSLNIKTDKKLIKSKNENHASRKDFPNLVKNVVTSTVKNLHTNQ